MNIKILLIAVLAISLAGCKNRTQQNQSTNHEKVLSVGTAKIEEKLQKEYLSVELDYLNDINYVGIGVVNPKAFDFQIVIDTATNETIDIENIEAQELLVPVFWKPDYLIFYMPVVSRSDKFYEVRAHKSMSAFVHKSEFDFYTWDDLLKNKALCVTILSGKGYSKPDIHSEVLFNGNETSLDEMTIVVEKIEGDWIYVRAELDDLVTGKFWIPWRDKNKLLVKPIFLM